MTSCGAVTAGGGGGAATVADGNCVTVDVAVGVPYCIWFDWFLISAMNRTILYSGSSLSLPIKPSYVL
jgi:hypothetical protein